MAFAIRYEFSYALHFRSRGSVARYIMSKITTHLFVCFVLPHLMDLSNAAIYTYEDVELRRIFPSEFPQDTIRKSGSLDPEHLGRYAELKHYFRHPKSYLNNQFEELICYNEGEHKLCKLDVESYAPEEEGYFMSPSTSYIDRRRVYCFMLLCFTEDELDRVVASF